MEKKEINVIEESEVTVSVIEDLLRSAYIDARIDDEGDIEVNYDDTLLWIKIRIEAKLLTIWAIYRFKESATPEQKKKFLTEANGKYTFSRFLSSNSEDKNFYADYSIVFKGGIIPMNFIFAIRTFVRITTSAISKCDEDDIVL